MIEGADRITVKLTDGRSLPRRRGRFDADTDIALIKVRTQTQAPARRRSATRTIFGWANGSAPSAIPLAYEHTVTVGVVSFIGRKLFDMSLDNYIQTDAAINFGNSGGPLINARGEVIGINSAISRQASSIGFAVPINQAKLILPQLKDKGGVSRGYIGVALRDVDPDLQASLKLAEHGRRAGPGRDGGIARRARRAETLRPDHGGGRPRCSTQQRSDSRDRRARARLDRAARGHARRPTARAHRSSSRSDRPSAARAAGRTRVTTGSTGRFAHVGPGELGLTVIEIDESNAHRFDVPARHDRLAGAARRADERGPRCAASSAGRSSWKSTVSRSTRWPASAASLERRRARATPWPFSSTSRRSIRETSAPSAWIHDSA